MRRFVSAPLLGLLGAPLLGVGGCQPATVDIRYDKDGPLYGSDGGGGGGGGGSGAGGWGDDPSADLSGEFFLGYTTDGGWTGAVDCKGWWSFTGTEASTECPGCWYTLDMAYDVTFTFAPDESLLPVGCENTGPGYYASMGTYGDAALAQSFGLWGVSSDYYGSDEPVFLRGWDYDDYYGYDYGTYWYPMFGTDVDISGDRLDFRYDYEWTYGGYYGYYDYASSAAEDYTVRQVVAGYGTRR